MTSFYRWETEAQKGETLCFFCLHLLSQHISVPGPELELGIEDKGTGNSNPIIIAFFLEIILDSQEVARSLMDPSPSFP